MNRLTRGRVAERAGVGVEALRFYERKGLIPQPPRSRSGYRLYPPETVNLLRFIRRAQELGFSLGEIAELLALQVDPDADCADVRRRALAKLEEVESKIRDLKRVRHVLVTLSKACTGHGPVDDCAVLEALTPAEGLD
jgi:MerR family copper efflux transcriptional regulator